MQHGENNNVRVPPGEVDCIWKFLAQRPTDRLEALRIGVRLFLDYFERTVNLHYECSAQLFFLLLILLVRSTDIFFCFLAKNQHAFTPPAAFLLLHAKANLLLGWHGKRLAVSPALACAIRELQLILVTQQWS